MVAQNTTAIVQAVYDLGQEQIDRFSDRLPWLHGCEIIPPQAIEHRIPDFPPVESRYMRMASWLADQVGAWSAACAPELAYEEVFDRHQLQPDEQRLVRRRLSQEVGRRSLSGIVAMAETVATVPLLATRQGIAREQWGDLARRGRWFGEQMAKYDFYTRMVVRTHLGGGIYGAERLDPSRLLLDTDTGLATVTPLPLLLEQAHIAVRASRAAPHHRSTGCNTSAMELGDRTILEAVWTAFAHAAETHLYPLEMVRRSSVAPPDRALEATEVADLFSSTTRLIIRQVRHRLAASRVS